MVDALRASRIDYGGPDHIDGLYIVGNSNVRNLERPHLPTLAASEPTENVPNVPLDSDGKVGIHCPSLFDVFTQGDIVWADSRRKVLQSIISSKSTANTLLVTEQCDNRCQFCSQPPKELPDDYLYERAALALLNFDGAEFVGVSGGEPTLNRQSFLAFMRLLKSFDCKTPLHILTNGRRFSDTQFIEELSPFVQSKDILWGIPLYGYSGNLHDDLVQADGAFVETYNGLLNLAAIGQSVELRIVPVQRNISELPRIVELVANSFPFVTMISIMNLEPKGWARKNYSSLNVPIKQQVLYLEKSISIASIHGITVNLFNYPLCLIPNSIWDCACQSISDWKNYYPEPCQYCDVIDKCGGFFTSANGKFIEPLEPIQL